MAYMTNSNAEDFGDLTAGANVVVSHGSLIFNYGVAGELLLWTGALAASRTFVAGDPIELPAGALDINLPAGALEDEAVKAAYDALIADKSNLTMSLGTGAMGAAGKTNEVSGRGYSRQVVEITTGLGAAP